MSLIALAGLSLLYPLGASPTSDAQPQLLPTDNPVTTPVPSSTENAVLPSATVPELQQIARATGRDPSAPRAPNADLSPSGPRMSPSGSLSPVADGGPVRLGRSSGGGSTILRDDSDRPSRTPRGPATNPIDIDPNALGQGVALDTTSAAVPVVDDGTGGGVAPSAASATAAPVSQQATAEAPVPSAPVSAQSPVQVETGDIDQVASGPAPQVTTGQQSNLPAGSVDQAPITIGQGGAGSSAPAPAPSSAAPAEPQIALAAPRANASSAPTPRAPSQAPSLALSENPDAVENSVTLGAGIRSSQPKNKKAMAAEVQRRLDAAQKRDQQKQAEADATPQRTASLAPQSSGSVVGPDQTTYLNTLPVQTLNYSTAFRSNRVAFDAPDTRPLLSVILVDIGSEGVSRDALQSIQFPVTYAIEANMVGAADASRAFRALGFETLAMMPYVGELVFNKGDAASRLDQNIGALLGAVPSAVGLVDRIDGPFPLDANLSRSVLAALQVTGHGLLTHRSRGLNQVDRQARSVGVPSAAIARVIDARPGRQTVRTAMDRAVLDASKTGASVVIGRTDAETMTALMSWVLGPGGKSVLLAPVSASIERLSR
ncbi:MAG: divergent polysaccharide deacetylase family protein [Pseudomonadota bacterium]